MLLLGGVIIKSKLLILILAFLILFSFFSNVYAEVLTATLGLKVFMAILASMGVITTLHVNDIDLSDLYDEFLDYADTVLQVKDLAVDMTLIGLQSIYNSTKMRVSSVVSYIKTFLKYKFDMTEWDIDLDLPDMFFVTQGHTSLFNTLDFSNKYPEVFSIDGYNFREISSGDIGKDTGYTYKLGLRFASGYASVGFHLYYNNKRINVKGSFPLDNDYNLSRYYGDDVRLMLKFGLSNSLANLGVVAKNFTKNTYEASVCSYPVEPLAGLVDLDIQLDMDLENLQALPVPYGLTLPWQLALGHSISAYVGQHIDSLVKGIDDINIRAWEQLLLDFPKARLDALPVPKVIVDENGIILDIEVPDIPDDLVEQKQQTGLLGGILSLLQAILDLLKELFIPDASYVLEKYKQLYTNMLAHLNIPDLDLLSNNFKGIQPEPFPDLFLFGHKVVDSSYLNNFATTVREWQRFFWWLVYVMMNVNNVYRLIRGHSLVGIIKKE